MIKKDIIRGRFVKFDVGGTRVTDSLIEALNILDEECRGGSGGTWDIHRSGRKIVATPVDGPFDSLAFNPRKKAWDVL
jgi:hypothetical protein